MREGPVGERDLSWLDGSVSVDLSDDGRLVLISEQGSGAGSDSYAAYLRNVDGGPAVRLGDGLAQSLSPNGASAAVVSIGNPGRSAVVLLPTGPGEARALPRGPVAQVDAATWFPDGRQILFAGSEPGQGIRLYVQGSDQGPPRPISAEGIRFPFGSKPVSPDGRSISAVDRDGSFVIQPADGSPLHPVPAPSADLVPIRWALDGKSVYAFRRGDLPARIFRVDVGTGSSTEIGAVAPSDRAGARPPIAVQLTPDVRLCAYSYSQTLNDLYLVQGLK